LQVNHLQDTPLILVGKMWPGLVDWAKESMLSADSPLANAEDMDIPKCVADGDEATALIRKFHAQWLKKRDGKPSVKKATRKSKSRPK
jgi:hypothetical protein